MKVTSISPSINQVIIDILNRGNQVEIKCERENIVVVEIRRQAKIKVTANGQ